eukprot:UN34654
MNNQSDTRSLFDTGLYPIDNPECDSYAAIITRAKSGLHTKNCAILENFIRPTVLEAMQAEAELLVPDATYTRKDLNPYFSVPGDDVPEGHPLKSFSPRVHGMVRGDRFGGESIIRAIFENTDLCRFVADCLDYEKLFPYRDPYGCFNINVQPP